MRQDVPVLIVADAQRWSRWLAEHGRESKGVWLVLAKKGTVEPTSLSYDQALAEAICHGWVDGQLSKGDEQTFRRRFTPRRPGSAWSKRNVLLANQLLDAGKVRPGGLAAIERAKAEGTWAQAYDGQAAIGMQPDLASALAANPSALTMFEELDAANRYTVLYRVATAKREETRRRRVEQFVAMLARGDKPRP